MPVTGLFGQTIELLSKNIDLRAKNHNYISANLANVETPGYTPSRLNFEDELKSAIAPSQPMGNGMTNARHIPLKGRADGISNVKGKLSDTSSGVSGKDENRVDIEKEMAALAENQIMYNASVQLIAKKFESLKQAIKGSGN